MPELMTKNDAIEYLLYMKHDVHENMTDDEFEVALKEEIAKYDKHWKKCICIWVTN